MPHVAARTGAPERRAVAVFACCCRRARFGRAARRICRGAQPERLIPGTFSQQLATDARRDCAARHCRAAQPSICPDQEGRALAAAGTAEVEVQRTDGWRRATPDILDQRHGHRRSRKPFDRPEGPIATGSRPRSHVARLAKIARIDRQSPKDTLGEPAASGSFGVSLQYGRCTSRPVPVMVNGAVRGRK